MELFIPPDLNTVSSTTVPECGGGHLNGDEIHQWLLALMAGRELLSPEALGL